MFSNILPSKTKPSSFKLKVLEDSPPITASSTTIHSRTSAFFVKVENYFGFIEENRSII
jgi:hypothetical protein